MSVVLVSLLLLTFLIVGWRDSPETAGIVGSTPTITISQILANRVAAVDVNQDAVSWHYQLLKAQDEQGLPVVCGPQSLINPIAYRGGARISLSSQDNGRQICFRATDGAGQPKLPSLSH